MAQRFNSPWPDEEWVHKWPFVIPQWADGLGCTSSNSAIDHSWRQAEDLVEIRAKLRLAKREMKIARAEGTFRRTPMPGSWLD